MQEEIKSIDFQLDDEAEGKVSAVFSVFNNLDSDGDVVVPGAIKSKWDSEKAGFCNLADNGAPVLGRS